MVPNCDALKVSVMSQRSSIWSSYGVFVQLYDPETSSYRNVDRTFLRTLDENTILTQGHLEVACCLSVLLFLKLDYHELSVH
jgi:hypothetical protein